MFDVMFICVYIRPFSCVQLCCCTSQEEYWPNNTLSGICVQTFSVD